MSKKFEEVYKESLRILKELENKGCVKKEELWITESEDHVKYDIFSPKNATIAKKFGRKDERKKL